MALRLTTLFFAPTRQYVEAQIVEITADLAEEQIHRGWWSDDALLHTGDHAVQGAMMISAYTPMKLVPDAARGLLHGWE